MTDVHEVYADKRRWRIWPMVVLILVALLAIGVLVAMIMNIHGSISWPAGEVRFGFWPSTTTSVSAPETIAPPARVATEVTRAPAPATPAPQAQQAPQAQPAQKEPPPAATPPHEETPLPVE
jgi:hypothetical protein